MSKPYQRTKVRCPLCDFMMLRGRTKCSNWHLPQSKMPCQDCSPTQRRQNADGYIYIQLPSHPGKHGATWHLEHRWVIAKQERRFLERRQWVHHINGDRADNRLENLQLMTDREHGLHHNLFTRGIS